jgi:hypothetical protein
MPEKMLLKEVRQLHCDKCGVTEMELGRLKEIEG